MAALSGVHKGGCLLGGEAHGFSLSLQGESRWLVLSENKWLDLHTSTARAALEVGIEVIGVVVSAGFWEVVIP